jgi:hypothetical protein
MRKHAPVSPNYAVRDALLALQARGNAKAQTLVVEAKASVTERTERFAELRRLCDLARIPGMIAPAGYTSRAERVARELAYLGGEEYQEGLSVLKFARNSRADWANALACFGPLQQAVA